MTSEPSTFEDWSGDTLKIRGDQGGVSLRILTTGDDDVSFDVAAADVRTVTAVMLEKAGLPDRWAALKDIIFCLRPDGMSGEAYRRFVVESMGRLEAGQ
jgi:hypothetical protein